MQIAKFTFNPFAENTYIIFDETKEALIIDPGMYGDDEEQEIVAFIEKNNLKPVKIVNTHCHIDHIWGIDFLKEKYNLKLYANKDDEYLLHNAIETSRMYGIIMKKTPSIDEYINEKNTIKFGNSTLKIFEVPGHSAGHLAFYSINNKFIITGDTLFNDTIGRTDLPGGNLDQLISSIKTKIFSLESDYTVFAGHGANTDIGTEQLNNPFLK